MRGSAGRRRAQQDTALTMKIHTMHIESRGTYGASRIHAELAAQGLHVGRKRVARLMRAARVQGVSRRKLVCTTTRDGADQPAPDLVQRHFQAAEPDRLWVADITHVPTGRGFSTSRSSSTPGAAASSGGPWRRIYARSSC
jgi:putative transposase